MAKLIKLIGLWILVLIERFKLADSACSDTPTVTETGAKVYPVEPKHMAVVMCTSDGQSFNSFSTGDTAITLYCVDNAWEDLQATCDTSATVSACSGAVVGPDESAPETITDGTTPVLDTVASVLRCTDTEKKWLSGEPARVAQCRAGAWVPVLDICDDDCPLPRDCAAVQELGFSNSGDYLIVPSGNALDTSITVYCDLTNNDTEGGGWTVIHFNDGVDMADSGTGYDEGLVATNAKFIGLKHLNKLTYESNGDTRPHTLEVILNDGTNEYIATYDNFTVGSATDAYAMTSLGTYHGNAGDGLCPHVFTTFSRDDSNVGWWGDSAIRPTTITDEKGSVLTASTMRWEPLTMDTSVVLATSKMRIRPTAYDNTMVCPPITGYEPYWTTTSATVNISREVGATITYECLAELHFEPKTQTRQGTVTCEGSPPAWSGDIDLPCRLICPTGFHITDAETACIHFSTDTATGVSDAALKCLAMNATLAVIDSVDDLAEADAAVDYFTAHTYWPDGNANPAVTLDLATLTCITSPCATAAPTNCLTFKQGSQYDSVNCNTAVKNYACMLPAVCPDGFFGHNGGCYKIVAATTPLAAEPLCNAEMSSLAYPTSEQMFEEMATAFKKNTTSGFDDTQAYVIGLNKADLTDTWTYNAKYPIADTALETRLGVLTEDFVHWQDTAANFDLTAAGWDTAAAGGAVCQWLLYHGCRDDLPDPLDDMVSDNISTKAFADSNAFNCSEGYFVNSNISIVPAQQTMTCRGPLGEWFIEGGTLYECIRVPVCENAVPTISNPDVTKVVDGNELFLGGNITYVCQPNMSLPTSNLDRQNLTCAWDATAMIYAYTPDFINCTVCMGEPIVEDATTDYLNTTEYEVDGTTSFVTATCSAKHEISKGVATQTIDCIESGWNMTSVGVCRMACVENPPEAGLNMTAENVTEQWVGTELTYTCDTGYNLESNGTLLVEPSTKVTCNATGDWETVRGDLDCYMLCLAEPASPPASANTSWVGDGTDSRREGAQVDYYCADGHIWGNRTIMVSSFCESGTWTAIPTDVFICSEACLVTPPPTIGDADREWDDLWLLETEHLNYSCPAGKATTTGLFHTSLTCTYGALIPTDPTKNMTSLTAEFVCLDACPGPPMAAPYPATYNFTTDFTEGAVVAYSCEGGWADDNTTHVNECENGNWTVFALPVCITVTSSGPTTTAAATLPPPRSELKYGVTTTSHWATILAEMEDIDGDKTDYLSTDAPFGFGYAVKIDSTKQQCLKQTDFSIDNSQLCLLNPADCMATGLSFSIWEKHVFRDDIFDFTDPNTLGDDETEYILSSGGDHLGHVGIALYHYGIFQIAIVSNGTHYWKVMAAGTMFNEKWNNIGIKWHPEVQYDANHNPVSGGLALYVNLKKISSEYFPKTVPGGAKPHMTTPELMLGCHKTSTLTEYRLFGNGEYDELAYWSSELKNNETLYFLGGYDEDFATTTPDEFLELLDDVDLSNDDQLASAFEFLTELTAIHDKPETTAPPTDESTMATILEGSPTPSGPNQVESLSDEASVQRLETLREISYKLLDPALIKDSYTYATGVGFLNLMELGSNLMDLEYKAEWLQMQSNGSEGVAGIRMRLDEFVTTVFCRIQFNNNTAPITVVKRTKNIVSVGYRMLVEDFTGKGPMIEEPNWNIAELVKTKEDWGIFDRARIPTGIFNDERCDKRPMCLMMIIYDTYDDIAPCPTNMGEFPQEVKHEMDSRSMTYHVSVDYALKANGEVDTAEPECEVDRTLMAATPMVMKFEHCVKIKAIRDVKFHADEEVSDISVRRCAIWNANLSDYGVWDTAGCQVVEHTDMYTKCACDNFGMFGIIAEKVPAAEVPDEPFWVSCLKYVLYFISGLLLILYSLVVIYSSDLKDQFHMMGLNLAICVLLGSVAMCMSDFDSIRTDRHMCTTFSTLIHFFYLSAGSWIACLGHASFRAITKGEVGGRLKSYSMISYGIAMMSVGVPFTFFLSDLGTDPRCFVSWENYGKAAFFFPQMIFTTAAFFFGFVVICNLSTPALRKEHLIDDYGPFCRGAAFVLIYFGFTWVFGLLAYMRFNFTEPDFFPIFQVTNSMTGIIIFIGIGLGSTRYRGVVAGQAKLRREKIKKMARSEDDSKNLTRQKSKDKDGDSGEESADDSRPSTVSSLGVPSRGNVAGRPGSRPVTPLE